MGLLAAILDHVKTHTTREESRSVGERLFLAVDERPKKQLRPISMFITTEIKKYRFETNGLKLHCEQAWMNLALKKLANFKQLDLKSNFVLSKGA